MQAKDQKSTKGPGSSPAAKKTSRAAAFSYEAVDDSSLLTLIDIVRKGISSQDFTKIVDETPFTLSEWAHYLRLSERTLQRAQKEKKAFPSIQSERIVELVMLYQYGVQVFGTKEGFDSWLQSVSIALGGRVPKELLDTQFGISMVKDALGRIEHGVLA